MKSKRKKFDKQAEALIRETIKLNASKAEIVITEGTTEIIGYFISSGIAVVEVLLGIWLLNIGFSSYPAAVNFGDKAVTTTGMITETSYESRTTGGTYPHSYSVVVPTIQFENKQGKIIRFKGDDDWCTRQCLGKEVQVLYAPDNPQLVMVEGGRSPLDKARDDIGWGIFMILGGIFMFIPTLSMYGKQFGSTRHS